MMTGLVREITYKLIYKTCSLPTSLASGPVFLKFILVPLRSNVTVLIMIFIFATLSFCESLLVSNNWNCKGLLVRAICARAARTCLCLEIEAVYFSCWYSPFSWLVPISSVTSLSKYVKHTHFHKGGLVSRM